MRRVTKENLTAQIDRLRKIKDEQGQLSMNGEYTLQVYEMLLATMEAEPVAWGNGCDKTVPAALRYLAKNERPFGGESRFNAAHLYQLAREIELMSEAPLYRHAQPAPVVPEEMRKRPYRAHGDYEDGLEDGYADGWNVCRAAMLNQK